PAPANAAPAAGQPNAVGLLELPVALHGSLAGSNLVEARFVATGGQELMIEVESRRLGGKVRPVVHLLDASRRQIAWSWPQQQLGGDTRLTVKLPTAGSYTVQLHDAEYSAAAPSHFRLKIGNWDHAELAYPPLAPRGSTAPIELIGRLPSKAVSLPADATGEFAAAPWPAGAAASGPRVAVRLSDDPELLEQPTGAAPQDLGTTLPISLSGRLAQPGEQDRYQLTVNAGDKLRFELFAARWGTSLDGVLVIQDEQGKQLARGDDGPGTTDPQLDFTVPANVSRVIVVVSDLLGRGDAGSIYRLSVSATPPPPAPGAPTLPPGQIPLAPGTKPGFRLLTPVDRVRIPQGGRTVVPVLVERRGYDGPVSLSAATLPTGVAVDGAEIPPQFEGCLLTLSADGAAQPALVLSSLRGVDATKQMQRELAVDGHPLGEVAPWLRSELPIAVVPAAPFQVAWPEPATELKLPLAGKQALPVRIQRNEGVAGPVRLSLITAQVVPKVNGNPDQNRTLRAEQATVEIAADKSDGALNLIVPADLAAPAYDVAVVAELLSPDKKTVLGVATTPPKRLAVSNPIVLELATTALDLKIDAKAGATAKFTGRVQRNNEFKGDVTLAATGQPGGVRADNVVVKGDATEFTFSVVFPANFKPADVAGIRLVATGVPDPARPNPPVRTKEIELKVKVTAE
ncbi:MAG TPA: hypothetical protein PLV92_16680, partial [Pirellulaceae bacterium]|nr:hypothetical protein [Pirellulaceae bacterium]